MSAEWKGLEGNILVPNATRKKKKLEFSWQNKVFKKIALKHARFLLNEYKSPESVYVILSIIAVHNRLTLLSKEIGQVFSNTLKYHETEL